ncbi:NMD3 [Enterospora canceri]|uniref:60S ribosomal export protein NMD3 n=1 Tax=Enterospora canceri TaxID=1081671 RepID=A0A1Y1S6M4_9MICR|nr:NMD3 [Enterospora canceri]
MVILCCNCGIDILPDSRNMCDRCTINTGNFLSKIRKTTVIESCRGCERYHIPPKSWREYAWGSQDLLMFCIGKNKTIKDTNIVDTAFIKTEEHSKTILIDIKVENEGIIQRTELKYVVRNRQCGDCMRRESKQFWNSAVQLRQHPSSTRTFLYLELLIKMHRAHLDTSNIKERKSGIDFYFTCRNSAVKFTKFLNNFYFIKSKDSNRLISEDRSNNTVNQKSTFSCELLPFCTDDLVAIKNKLYLVKKVKSVIEVTELETGATKTYGGRDYFGNELDFKQLQRSGDLVEYDVLISYEQNKLNYVTLCDSKERTFEVETEMKLKENDCVLGYYTVGKWYADQYSVQDVILARKYNNKKKEYKMKIEKELDREMRLFIEDIAEEKAMLEEVVEIEPNELTKKFMKL